MFKPSRFAARPGGLYLPLHAKLVGRVRWQVLDERGVPEVPRTPSGFAIAPIDGVRQPNLITDAGMDQIASYNVIGGNTSLTSVWREWLRVGTGSTAPANSDTALDNQVQDGDTSGSFEDDVLSGELDTTANEWVGNSIVTRVVTMDADRNLTEFGFSPYGLRAGDLGIRELLRDGVGTPITVSLLTGKALRVDHELEIRIPAPAAGNAVTINREEYDATNTLTATVPMDVVHGGWVPTATSGNIIPSSGIPSSSTAVSIIGVWHPLGVNAGLRRLVNSWAYTRVGSAPLNTDLEPSAGTADVLDAGARIGYVPGSYEVIKRWTVAAGDGNGDWYGAWLGTTFSGADARSAWVITFDSPATYTKVNTNTLRFGIVSSWARG